MKLQEKEKKINEITEEEKRKDVQYIIKKSKEEYITELSEITKNFNPKKQEKLIHRAKNLYNERNQSTFQTPHLSD